MNSETIVLVVLALTTCLNQVACINSYIYLSDKSMSEELPSGSAIANLKAELSGMLEADQLSDQQFTLLEDSKQPSGSVYFRLNATSGELATNQLMDREVMCLNRQCAEACEANPNHQHHHSNPLNYTGSCRMNLKVLIMPSYNILNLNVFIEDTNDNAPLFRTRSVTKQISENVPVGYKIPIDLAYDPDVGKNKIQSYEILSGDNRQVEETFKLLQNLNEGQLHLVVTGELDREQVDAYSFVIAAYDGGQPPLSDKINVTILITDVNDNNPVFEKDYYSFSVREDAPLDTIIGQVNAFDLDEGLNAQVKYSFVDKSGPLKKSAIKNFVSYFELNESSGMIRLKKPVDFEDEHTFVLIVEAKDAGIGSLPSQTTVEITLTDVNDNPADISVSFLNLLHKNKSTLLGYKYDLYLPENTKSNKFLAHVNINDKDSGLNGLVEWKILVNNKQFINSTHLLPDTNSILKLIRLNNNSFTINVGNTSLLDRETNESFNVSIIAWDLGVPRLSPSYFNFTIVLIDENDNAPRFELNTHEVSVYENNEPNVVLFKLTATDPDKDRNAAIKYEIKEDAVKSYLSIDNEGEVRSKVSFDHEQLKQLVFNVVASDGGKPSLASSTRVVLNVLDLNDNAPQIHFTTSFLHQQNNNMLHMKVGKELSIGSKLVEFDGNDLDSNENSQVEFLIEGTTSQLPFLLSNGVLSVARELKPGEYKLNIVCQDLGKISLNSTLEVHVVVADSSQYCIESHQAESQQSKYINKDSFNKANVLFSSHYRLNKQEESGTLEILLLSKSELVEVKLANLNNNSSSMNAVSLIQTLEIRLKASLNASLLTIGKHLFEVKLFDSLSPSCGRVETFELLIGNNNLNERELLAYLDSSKPQNTAYSDADSSSSHVTGNSLKTISKYYKVKPATLFMKSDYILLIILIGIVLITGTLITLIGIVCFCNRIKKKYKHSGKKVKMSLGNRRLDPAELAGVEIVSTKTFLSKNKNPKRMRPKQKRVDLNCSDTTSSSKTNSLGKPQYLLVNNSSSSSSSSSTSSSQTNGTLIYRDPDFDEFGIVASSTKLVKQQQVGFNHKPHYQNQQHYIYSATLGCGKHDPNVLNIYESSDRSNSATNSIVESSAIDDTKSTSSNNDFEMLNQSGSLIKSNPILVQKKLKSYRNQSSCGEPSSSAYSSISNSDNGSCIENHEHVSQVSRLVICFTN